MVSICRNYHIAMNQSLSSMYAIRYRETDLYPPSKVLCKYMSNPSATDLHPTPT